MSQKRDSNFFRGRTSAINWIYWIIFIWFWRFFVHNTIVNNEKKNKNEKEDNINPEIQNTINVARIKNLYAFNKGIKKFKCTLYGNIFIFVYVDFIEQISSVIFYVIQDKKNY